MACDDFVTKSPWTILQTQGRTVWPFIPDNVVRISGPIEGNYTVEVFKGTDVQGSYPGFTCSGTRLDGKAEDTALRLTTSAGPNRAHIMGEWDPLQATTGTWTGDEGGGGGGKDEA